MHWKHWKFPVYASKTLTTSGLRFGPNFYNSRQVIQPQESWIEIFGYILKDGNDAWPSGAAQWKFRVKLSTDLIHYLTEQNHHYLDHGINYFI